MSKKSTIDYVCQTCGMVYPKWQGKCDGCGEWNSIVEEKKPTEVELLSEIRDQLLILNKKEDDK